MIKTVFWNADEHRVRALWRVLSMLVLTSVLILGVSYALVPLIGGLVTAPLATTVGILTGTWLSGWVLDRRPFADFGFHHSRGWWLDFAFGLVLGVLMLTAIFLIEYAAGWIVIDGTFYVARADQSFGMALSFLLLNYVCVGFYEELLARGYLLRNMAEGFNGTRVDPRHALIAAWMLSSVLFGLGHALNPNASVISTFNVTVAGVFIGLGYVLTGELALPIGLHIAWNFMEGPVFGFPVSGTRSSARVVSIEQQGPDLWTGGAFGPEAGLLGLGAMLAGMGGIVAWVRTRHEQSHLLTALAQPPRLSEDNSSNNTSAADA